MIKVLFYLMGASLFLPPHLLPAQVDPPYDDWLENKFYVTVDPGCTLQAVGDFRSRYVFTPMRLNQDATGYMSSFRTAYMSLPADRIQDLDQDTCSFTQTYGWDSIFLVLKDADSMWVTIKDVGFTSYYIRLPFSPGKYELTLEPPAASCSTTFDSGYRSVGTEGGFFVIENLPTEHSPTTIRYDYLKPCYDGTYPLTSPVKAWDVSPADWSRLKL